MKKRKTNSLREEKLKSKIRKYKTEIKKLRASEALWQTYLYNAPNVIFTINRKFEITFMNYTLKGFDINDVIGKSIFNFLPEESHKATKNAIDKAFRTGKKQTYEVRGYGEKGKIVWYSTEVGPIKNKNKIDSVVVIATDITKRVEAIDALQKSEQKFSLIFRKSPFAAALTSLPDGKFVEINEEFVHQFEYSQEEVIGKTSLELDLYLDKNERQRIGGIMQSNSLVRNTETKMKTKSGKVLDILISSDFIEIGSEKFILTTSKDITERKRNEADLRESENRLRKTLDGMIEGCQIIGNDWRYKYLNRTAEIHNRRPNEALLGKKYMEMWPGIEDTVVFAKIKNCMDEQHSHYMENEFTFPDGHKGWFELRIQPVPEGVFILSIDITIRKQAEYEILQRNKEMEILDSIIKTTTTKLALKEILDAALNGAIQLTGLEGGTICLVDNEMKVLALSVSKNSSPEMFEELSASSIKIGDCLCGRAAETGEPLILWDNASGSEYATYESVREEGIHFHAAFPLITSEKTHGVLCVFSRSDYKPSERSLAVLKELCITVALAIENSKLYEEAVENNVILENEIAERVRANKELLRNRKTLQLFVEHAPAAIAMFDNDMKYLAYSKRFLKDYGLGEQNIIGKTHYEVFPEMPERWKAIHRRCLAGDVEKADEDPFIRADGSTDWVRWEIHPWRNENGEIGGIILFSEVITERKNAEADKLNLMNRIVEAEEKMKKTAAQQLHDEIGQNLTALMIHVNYVSTQLVDEAHGKMKKRLDDSVNLLNETIEQVRNIMTELRPAVLDDYGLNAALSYSLNKFSETTNIKVRYEGKDFDPRLPINIAYALFRVTQEALHNISKHARAKNVDVKLEEFDHSVRLTICDDGVGFDYQPFSQVKKAQGLGLISIEERIKFIGGKLEIFSSENKGTVIQIEVKR